ncbi:hypothetical protein HMPREF9715_00928 [Myroides odoratimimus CIP 101113]|uniref:Uncharacterized protein n=2 Tax=Myroides odoratimimus TaxID=76832 RepID=A0AAV3F6N3_9FLAO|nr:hypothetical protein HMPREF9715_00928 [Myroides odoratimimus CIP 101113]
MSMLSKIPAGFSICKIYLDFDGLVFSELGNNFSNSVDAGTNWIATHFGKSSVSFKEESFNGVPGLAFKQTLTIKLPYLDKSLAKRTHLFHSVKNIKIAFNNGQEISIGRNDIRQNRPPKIESKSDGNFLIVEFYTESMMATGIIITDEKYLGFPEILPINLDVA